MYQSILENFIQKKHSYCQSSHYDKYDILNDAFLKDAQTKCESNSKCIGIYDENCDKIGPFGVCKERLFQSISATNDCVYQKKDLDGM